MAGMVATIDDAARLAFGLPQVTEGLKFGHRTWYVAGKSFAWERPLSKADIKRFGPATPPDGPLLAVSVADLGEKEAVLQAHPDVVFSITHFDGYAAVLVKLNKVGKRVLKELVLDAWLAAAPPALAEEYLKR